MIAVRVIAGDEDGGPHAEVTYDLDRDVDDLKDEEIKEFRNAVAQTYSHWFGGPPNAVIVTIAETADDSASDDQQGSATGGKGGPT